jgi:hypothetical protein
VGEARNDEHSIGGAVYLTLRHREEHDTWLDLHEG